MAGGALGRGTPAPPSSHGEPREPRSRPPSSRAGAADLLTRILVGDPARDRDDRLHRPGRASVRAVSDRRRPDLHARAVRAVVDRGGRCRWSASPRSWRWCSWPAYGDQRRRARGRGGRRPGGVSGGRWPATGAARRSRSPARCSASTGSGSRSRTPSCCASSRTATASFIDVLRRDVRRRHRRRTSAGGCSAAGHWRPTISPNKTVEGLFCGMLAAILAVFLAGLYQTWLTQGDALLLGVAVAVLAPLGDLFESHRQARRGRQGLRQRCSGRTAARSTASTRPCSRWWSATTSG